MDIYFIHDNYQAFFCKEIQESLCNKTQLQERRETVKQKTTTRLHSYELEWVDEKNILILSWMGETVSLTYEFVDCRSFITEQTIRHIKVLEFFVDIKFFSKNKSKLVNNVS